MGRLRDLLTTTEKWVYSYELWEETRDEIVKSKKKNQRQATTNIVTIKHGT